MPLTRIIKQKHLGIDQSFINMSKGFERVLYVQQLIAAIFNQP